MECSPHARHMFEVGSLDGEAKDEEGEKSTSSDEVMYGLRGGVICLVAQHGSVNLTAGLC